MLKGANRFLPKSTERIQSMEPLQNALAHFKKGEVSHHGNAELPTERSSSEHFKIKIEPLVRPPHQKSSQLVCNTIHGQVGMMHLLDTICRLYKTRQDKLLASPELYWTNTVGHVYSIIWLGKICVGFLASTKHIYFYDSWVEHFHQSLENFDSNTDYSDYFI